MWRRFSTAAVILSQLAAAEATSSYYPFVRDIPSSPIRRYVRGVEVLGGFAIPGNYTYKGTKVGGISGLAYDPDHQVYYALTCDKEEPRYYTLRAYIDDDFGHDDFHFLEVTYLKDHDGNVLGPNTINPQDITYIDGTIIIVSEGFDTHDPALLKFNLTGHQYHSNLEIPDYYEYSSTAVRGSRPDKNLKSLTISPDGDQIWTALETFLEQDGLTSGPSRMLRVSLGNGQPRDEFVYDRAEPGCGLVGLIALDDDGTFLTMERNNNPGDEKKVRLYEVITQGSLNARGQEALADPAFTTYNIKEPVCKTLIADFEIDLDLYPANFEAMAMQLLVTSSSSAKYQLLIMSDNHFRNDRATKVVTFEVDINEHIPVVEPNDGTPEILDDINAVESQTTLRGVSSDPAVWVHPDYPKKSLIIGTLVGGGLATFDLDANLVQRLDFTGVEAEFIAVDIIYAFPFDGGKTLIDLAVVTDNYADALRSFKIDRETGALTEVTSALIPNVFPDDLEGAFGVATYTSPYTGFDFVFVSQKDGNKVSQLFLFEDSEGRVNYDVPRTLEIPLNGFPASAAQARGLVVDRERGELYISTETAKGILRTEAEPFEKDIGFGLVENHDDPKIKGKLKGMTLYYGGDHYGEGYLIVSSEGDSSYFVYERQGDNDFVGRFGVTVDGRIDHGSRTEGVAVMNINLGPEFPCGLFILNDALDEPQELYVQDGSLVNIRSNFKLVAWEDIADSFKDDLDVNTYNWGPRRFALVIRLDEISEAIFKAFIEFEISPRDAETFLFDLDEAAVRLYKPGTRRRRIFSPIGRDTYHGKGKGGSKKRRDLRKHGETESRRLIKGTKGRRRSRLAEFEAARDEIFPPKNGPAVAADNQDNEGDYDASKGAKVRGKFFRNSIPQSNGPRRVQDIHFEETAEVVDPVDDLERKGSSDDQDDQCDLGGKGKGGSKGYNKKPEYDYIRDSLMDFAYNVKECLEEGRLDPETGNLWIDCAHTIISQLPNHDDD